MGFRVKGLGFRADREGLEGLDRVCEDGSLQGITDGLV